MKINHSAYFFNHRLYAGYDQAKKNFQENIHTHYYSTTVRHFLSKACNIESS